MTDTLLYSEQIQCRIQSRCCPVKQPPTLLVVYPYRITSTVYRANDHEKVSDTDGLQPPRKKQKVCATLILIVFAFCFHTTAQVQYLAGNMRPNIGQWVTFEVSIKNHRHLAVGKATLVVTDSP